MVLLQAGLGRRTISIPEEANHAEVVLDLEFYVSCSASICLGYSHLNCLQISSLFCEVFPKLRELDGAWMIYKAAGKITHELAVNNIFSIQYM